MTSLTLDAVLADHEPTITRLALPVFAGTVGLGLLGWHLYVAGLAWRHDSAVLLALATAALLVGAVAGFFVETDARAYHTVASSPPGDIVWVFLKRVRRASRREVTRLLCVGHESGAMIQLSLPMQADDAELTRLLDEAVTRWPLATVGYSPELKERFAKRPSSLRLSF